MGKFFAVTLLLLPLICLCSGRENALVAKVSNREIVNLVARMRSEDSNKASSRDVIVNFQGHTGTRAREDEARNKLFSKVSPSLLNKSTYKALMALFDNYIPRTGIKEIDTRAEDAEIDAFLRNVTETEVMEMVRNFLKDKGYNHARHQTAFRAHLKDLWFTSYSRKRGVTDSSAFEHTFVGEWKEGVQGMHNWLRFYQLEQQGLIDYKGFILKRGQIFSMVQFSWEDLLKPSGSFFIGTSPEFDLGVYTLCFLVRPGYSRCKFALDGMDFTVTSFDHYYQRKKVIGTVFPSPQRRG